MTKSCTNSDTNFLLYVVYIIVVKNIASRLHTTMLKQMDIKMGFAVVIALALVGIMYAIESLDKSNYVDTGCSYGVFRIGLSMVFITIIIAIYVKKWEGTIAVVKINIHGIEMFQFVLFFLAKLTINILNAVWYSSRAHLEGTCQIPGISITAQISDGVFNVLQFLCLLIISRRHWLLRSSIFYFLIAINCGLIWFDLSIEAVHLKHYTHDYDHLSKEWIFLSIQAIFWIGLEFHIIVVELLIFQRLENPFELRTFLRHSGPNRPQNPSKYQYEPVPSNDLAKFNSNQLINTVYSPVLAQRDNAIHF